MQSIDRVVFNTPTVSVGAFRCPVNHPSFRDSGPTQRHIVVFPRTGVWIRHAGSRPFAADPAVVSIYNAGQEYTRAPMHPEGDRCDWFGLSDDMARDVARTADRRAPEEDGVAAGRRPRRLLRLGCRGHQHQQKRPGTIAYEHRTGSYQTAQGSRLRAHA